MEVRPEKTNKQVDEVKAVENKYWETIYSELLPNTLFKISKLSGLDRLTITLNRPNKNSRVSAESAADYLRFWLWSKDGGNTWNPVLNESGTSRLPELDDEPQLGFDLAQLFLKEVIVPVFTESKISLN